MRQKVWDYLEKPSGKLKKQLTTMELNWAEAQKGVEKPAPQPAKKPSKQ